MRCGMMYKQGEIVLIPVPFSNLTSSKKRPVMILSNANYNKNTEDIIVAAVTSNIRGLENEVLFDGSDMESGNIPKSSCIRADKIYTLSKKIIVKRYGLVSERKVIEAKERLFDLITEKTEIE
jgi:mRNA interferase MazF